VPNEYEIATWRYEQIAPLLDTSLDRAARRRAIRDRTKHTVVWPNGEKKRIACSTLHRWLDAFRKEGYLSLLPRRRSDAGKPRLESQEWIDYAIALLYEQHERSLTQLGLYLKLQFPDYKLSRSTLNRHLHKHPAYVGIERLRGGKKKLRGRYQASYAHESWQLDGKGKFDVFIDGRRVLVHVLSVIDDYSRAILAARVAASESTEAAIEVFQTAAERWGLPDRMQYDRGSAFDSHDFRNGLAQCGSHRCFVLPRSPENQGKVEAYHRSLIRWFIDELKAQEICDLEHLQELLEAMIALVYQTHHHREIGCSPEERLAKKKSSHQVSRHVLFRAFYVDYSAKSEKKTGAVQLPNGRFQVPAAYAGKSCQFRYDRLRREAILITKDRRHLELEPFETKPLPPVRTRTRGQGQLQKLLDQWRGQTRPNAEPGFGLPEVFAAIKAIVGRPVPTSDKEAMPILDFWKRLGPIQRDPFLKACERAGRDLGPGRAIAAYLDHLERQIAQSKKED
jgi:transposase InsO family protein